MTGLSSLETLAQRVCDMAERTEAQARVSRARHGLTRFANSFIHQHHGEDTTTVSVKLSVEGKVAAASTTDTSDEALSGIVERLISAARLQPVDPHWPGVAGPAEAAGFDRRREATTDVRPVSRAGAVGEFVSAASDLSAAGYVGTAVDEIAVATTAGQVVSGGTTRATIDGIHRTTTSAGNGHQTTLDFSELDAGAVGARAADLARRGVDPIEFDPGEYEVVLAPECVATIAVFLAAYGFGGKSYLDGQSFVKLGERQFDPSFSLIDDPEDPRTITVPFDVEGTPKRTLPLVDRGVSRSIAYDRRTAHRAETESTGHATPVAYFGPVPTTLVVAGGSIPSARLVEEVDRGVYVSTFNYCRILDPRTQVVTGLTRNGTFLIEDGEITKPLKNLRFTQSFVKALAPGAIPAIGDDQRYADSEFGPGVVLAPSMRLASWNFTGGAQG